MEWTSLNDLRESYLKFFESKGCLRHKSYPLVPQNDKSLLLIVAGMAPLKPYFTGQEVPPRVRMTTCQKCIRTGEIENVGKPARHGTYFEMLGNFSFGDYFKKEAIAWAWEYVTEVLKLPLDRLHVSVYEDDDEAEKIWHEEIGVPMDHIVRMGKEDNFWEAGTDGPCGPCSEIYFDRGEKYGCGKPTCGVGCDCDRYMEFWNLVFTQFERHEDGTYTPLAQKNIDTGMGLERLAALMQGVDSIFDVDTVKAIRDHICKIAGCEYGAEYKKDVSIRVITDHIRAVTFLASDGVLPSNEGRGYVMRRLLRRAVRHGKLLGINGLFLKDLVKTVVDCNKCEYNELEEKFDYIVKVLTTEEQNFNSTIDRGMKILDEYIEKLQADGKTTLDGESCFKLSDTYGFPLDLTREILEEKGLSADEEGYAVCMEKQRETARGARESQGYMGAEETVFHKIDKNVSTKFTGYDKTEDTGVISYLANDEDLIENAGVEDVVYIVPDQTCFYAESGGQTGDTGIVETATGKAEVLDTQKAVGGKFALKVKVTEGALTVGQQVTFKVDKAKRLATMRNHSCAHLLQAALRSVLGDHVHQAGQLVDSQRLRFDFSHFEAMTNEEKAKVEALVNKYIFDALDITMEEMPIAEAQKLGAMALFGEKYGETVRVVTMGDKSDAASIEFCGGTHLNNTSKIGLFKIISENSVASGVRRIEAVTGTGVLELLNSNIDTINKASETLKLNNPAELVARCGAVMQEIKSLEKERDSLETSMANMRAKSVLENAVDVNGVSVATAQLTNIKPDVLRKMADELKAANDNVLVIMTTVNGEKGNIVAAAGKEAVAKGAHAGKIAGKIAALTNGKGGGRPDSAMAGVGDVTLIGAALEKAAEVAGEFIK
ncbi:alanine--tRNA ligase [Ruminococcus sp.]|uniref:alanine--tRNA ligase n=1 Tax=Ruminococcus sp. TaxID=41978 RepID=UPI0025867B37|nr:alanine--tRNA ligase [Ruminococcus sp.]MCR5022228.1 alanine--tRNA ligase [Ruminococcus sp.]